MLIAVVGEPAFFTELVAVSLRLHLESEGRGWEVVCSPDDTLASVPPDVVVAVGLGCCVPDHIDRLRDANPEAGVVWVGGTPARSHVFDAVDRGVSVILSGSAGAMDLIAGIEMASRGERWASADLVAMLLSSVESERPERRGCLSEREIEVLSRLRAGKTTDQVAAEMFISPHTARNHVRNILRKLGAHSRLEALAVAERDQLISHT